MPDEQPAGESNEPLTAEERVDRGVREAQRDYASPAAAERAPATPTPQKPSP